MLEILKALISSGRFMPHGHCYLWVPGLVWLHVLSDTFIGLSYVAISATLVYLVYRARQEVPFHTMFLAFGTFIVACGGTHFMEVWTLWTPTYWLAGGIKAITAVASLATAIALPPLVPLALGMIQAARLSEQRRAELEQANGELNRLYEKLKEFDELKTQFFANVSHELRTPLALILGPTEKLLTSPVLPASQRRDLEVIDRNARTLLKHVNDLLDVSKLEAGKMELEYAEVDLARLVRLTVAQFEVLAQERQITCRIEAPETLPAQVDAEKVQRIVLNLVSNAFKFTPNGGTIRCAISDAAVPPGQPAAEAAPTTPQAFEHAQAIRPEPRVTIAVADSGPGVQPQMRKAIFERFRQGEGSATRRFGGTGLGLAIARDFVELQGGTITVTDAPEGGALFTVELPLTAPPGVEVRVASSAMVALEAGAGAASEEARQALDDLWARVEAVTGNGEADQPMVLIVEDNVEMSRFLAETLAGQYRTATASDGQGGLERALALRPDLILSDVMMPRMSGDEMVRAVRARAELDAIPLIMLTAKADDDLRVQLLRDGAQDYLTKPFSAEELRARVGNLVAMKRVREVLQRELETQLQNLEALAGEVTLRKRELHTAVETLRTALEQAEHASQVKTHFLRLVSHELRTPLTTLQLQLQRLQRDREAALSPRQQEMVRRMSQASGRLLELIESLLEYARIESGRLDIEIEPVELGAMAAEVVEELRPQAEQKGLEMLYAPPPELPPLQSDRRLVRLIMVNLANNAIKYTEQGSVEVSLAHSEGAHRLAVRDTGPGIPADQQALIFEPFEQLEPLQRKHVPGVGLGLTLVKEMVQALGGNIEVRSDVGQGSIFTVILPPADRESKY